MPDQEAITKVQTGQSTEADVLEILGPPTSSSFSNAKRWFYIGEKMERLAFFDPKVSEKEVLIIDFNPQGIVASVQFVSTPHDFNTVPQSRITKTLGKDPSFLQQIFGNFGKFSRQSEKK